MYQIKMPCKQLSKNQKQTKYIPPQNINSKVTKQYQQANNRQSDSFK